MERYHIFLDDLRDPKDCCKYMPNAKYYWDTTFIVARNYHAFVSLIEGKFKSLGVLPETVTFDHDLADEHYAPEREYENYNEWAEGQNFQEKTGYDCAKWLSDFCMENRLPIPIYYVHSKNPTGAENITSLLENHKKHVLL